MDRRISFAVLVCAATTVFAANTVSPTFLWDGSTDTEGRVITGSPEETSGYWYYYNDEKEQGTSSVRYPPEFDINIYDGSIFDLLVETYGGIKATVELGEGAKAPHAGFGFNTWDEGQHGADITAWGGFCLEYSSSMDFVMQIISEDDGTIISHTYLTKTVAKSASITTVDYEWKDFLDAMVDSTTMAAVLGNTATVRLVFFGRAGESSEFFLKKIGSHGQCSGGTDAIKPVASSQVNVSVVGRTVNFEGVIPSAKVSVVNFQGQVVKSATAASSMDLRFLPSGIYMLRVQGHGVNHIQKIILK